MRNRVKDVIDEIGNKYGTLTVIERSFSGKRHRGAEWICRCECGNEIVARGYDLRKGHVVSCGCGKTVGHRRTHGEYKTRLYRIWMDMRARCNRVTATGYKYYGGRGISVCLEWSNSFEAFRDWSIANGYDETLTIDRIDVNGNYEPSNCRWTDWHTQVINRRPKQKKEGAM